MRIPSIIFFITANIIVQLGYSQEQPITTYYDAHQKQVKEKYFLSDSLPTVLHGPYTSYYSSGEIKSRGNFYQGTASGIWEYYYENGNLKMKGALKNNINHGLWIYFYEDGQVSMEGEIYQGKRNGLWKYFYENGITKRTGNFNEGEKKGFWKYYFEDGTLKARAMYENDIGRYKEYYPSGKILAEGLNIDGKSDSLWTYYFENGKVKAQGNYKNGMNQGHWKFYYPEGHLLSEGTFNKGKSIGKWTYYYKNGRKSSEGIENNGKKDGYWKLYYDNGEIKGEGFFQQGEGEYKEYYESGKIKISGHIKNEKNNGTWIYYYENGKREGIASFSNGKGRFKGYYEDGSLKMEGTIEDGVRTGIWKLYKKDGSLAGYYKAVYDQLEPLFEMAENAPMVMSDTLNDTLNYEKPEYRFKSRGSRYFKRRLNEFRGLIVAANPMAMIAGSVPFSMEYYMQERLGYELQYTYIRNPFFTSDSNILQNEVYDRGYSLAFKQKFYHDDESWGMWYFGHELRFTSVDHFANVNPLTTHPHLKSVSESEEKIEYAVFVGDRIVRESGESGITVDVFIGIGIGYRKCRANYNESTNFSQLFKSLPDSKISIPLRLGINLGYIF